MAENHSGAVTCWTLIHGAASGNKTDRSDFSHRYLPVVRSFFDARWRGSPLRTFVDDAVQEVFLDCLREGGVLAKAVERPPKNFHAFLLGAVRNVALRVERRWARSEARREPGSFHPDEMPSPDDTPSKLFDRLWAVSMIRQAGELQRRRARDGDAAARRRVELLRLRFEEGLAVREIAARWGEDPKAVHWVYRRARQEYLRCLREVLAFHNPGAADLAEQEFHRLLSLVE